MKGKYSLLLLIFLLYCKSYSSLQYLPEEKKDIPNVKKNQIVAILPFTDSRKGVNIPVSGLSFIPFVLWEKIEYNVERSKEDPGIFRIKDLRYAVLDEFKSYNLFSEVFLTEEIKPKNTDYYVKGNVLSTRNTTRMSLSGLSFVGIFLWYFGVPISYNNSELRIQLEFVESKTDKVIYSKEYSKEYSWVTGFYYNLDTTYKGHFISAQKIFPDFVRSSIRALEGKRKLN